MPPADDSIHESFRGLVLQLRGRIGLTQRELAARLGVHVNSIQGWEAGANYPGMASLRALIAVGVQAGGFSTGREAEGAAAIWAAALREAPRLQAPFDRAWFDQLASDQRGVDDGRPARQAAAADITATAPPVATTDRRGLQSWSEAPDVAAFVGREAERAQLRRWIVEQRCRVIALLGLGGLGKTLLATRLARDLAPTFELIYWRSLRDAPALSEWLAGVLDFLAPDDRPRPRNEADQINRLVELLGETRCLIVLDNFETILESGDHVEQYRRGYEGFGTLVRQLAEMAHQSCLVVTSREEPPELVPLRDERGPVRALDLGALGADDGRAVLRDRWLEGDDAAWHELVSRCGGNVLALKVAGETIRELFNSDIADYLSFVAPTAVMQMDGLRQLLELQIQRLSDLEHTVLRWLAIEREPVSLTKVGAELGPYAGRGAILGAVEALRRRSLLERNEGRLNFGLHSVVLEYVTEQILDEVTTELERGQSASLRSLPLVKATSPDYVRQTQERLIARPLLERLTARYESRQSVEQRLLALLDQWRGGTPAEQGAGPGNIVNLLRLLRGDLRGLDLSRLAIRQAFLQDVEAQDASLAGSHLSESLTAEALSYPQSVALSDDGRWLAAGTSTGDIWVWRVSDRTPVSRLQGHSGDVPSVALSSNGHLVASAGLDGTVRLWHAETGALLSTVSGHAVGSRSVALSADGSRMASYGLDGFVMVWEAESGRLLMNVQGHAGEVRCVALTDDGRLLASGSLDGTARLWDVTSGRLVSTLDGHGGGVRLLALSRDGRRLVCASYDGAVNIWDSEGGRLLSTIHDPTVEVWGVSVSADGRLVASAGSDQTVRIWEADSGRAVATLRGHTGGVWRVSLSGDGCLVASGANDATIRLWETKGGRLLATLSGHTGGLRGVAQSANGHLLASGSLDGTTRLWDVASGRLVWTLRGHSGGVRDVALSDDGRLLATASNDTTVRLWDTGRGRLLTTLRGHTGAVWCVALSGDGRLAASGSLDGTVRLWETAGGREVTIMQGQGSVAWGVALGGDGRVVASTSADETVQVWEMETGRPIAVLEGHTGDAWSVALSPDGHLAASGSRDGAIRVWEAHSGRPISLLHGHAGGAWSLAVSTGARLVASGASDGTVSLWSLDTGQTIAVLQGHVGGVYGVSLSRDGRQLASVGADETVKVWDTSSGACLGTLRSDRPYERLDICGLTGITEAQRTAMLALGAIEQPGHPTFDR